MAPTYPETPTVDQRDDYHGTEILDPYRWLEASVETEEVGNWVELQNTITRESLAGDHRQRELAARLTELWNFPKLSPPVLRGSNWFQLRNSGLQNQDVLYVMDSPTGEGRVLLDPNTLSRDGTVALLNISPSPDGKLLAYSISRSGSDWVTWQVMDVKSGENTGDRLEWSRFSGAAWLPDSSGFFYNRYAPPAAGQELLAEASAQELYLHLIGTGQDRDRLIRGSDDPHEMYDARVSDDGIWLVLHVSRGTEPRNLVLAARLDGGLTEADGFMPVVPDYRASYEFIGNDGDDLYFVTDDGAERGQVVAIAAGSGTLRTVIAEQEDLLDECTLLGDVFITEHLHDASHQLGYYSLDGHFLGSGELPALGTLQLGRASRFQEQLYLSFTSFLHATSVLVTTGDPDSLKLVWQPEVPFDAERYETTQEFATSKDGTRVPLFVVARKGLERNGRNRTVLYGYGGFNWNLSPSFSPSRLAWLEQGGVLAFANLRGGREYGRQWHEAGTLERKQNVFDDFIACAEHLIDTGVTSSRRLGIQGGSNGGLLVGACLTQRPDLFAAAHSAVGVLDMLRYHKFTIGWAWASDYGTSDNAGHFRFLLAYSPLHNIKDGTCYPATLLTTGDHDDRVVPGHSFKFAAALQAAQACDNPVLLRVQRSTGHGHGMPTEVIIAEQADIWTFFLQNLG